MQGRGASWDADSLPPGASPSPSGAEHCLVAARRWRPVRRNVRYRAPIFKRRYMSDKHIHANARYHILARFAVGNHPAARLPGAVKPDIRSSPLSVKPGRFISSSLPVNLCQNQPARVPNAARAATKRYGRVPNRGVSEYRQSPAPLREWCLSLRPPFGSMALYDLARRLAGM